MDETKRTTGKRVEAKAMENQFFSNLDGLRQQAEDYVRQDPMKAAAFAFGAGYLLARLPLGGLIATLLAIMMPAIKPALIVCGAIKLFQESQRLTDND